jgi:hypothetical protein
MTITMLGLACRKKNIYWASRPKMDDVGLPYSILAWQHAVQITALSYEERVEVIFKPSPYSKNSKVLYVQVKATGF